QVLTFVLYKDTGKLSIIIKWLLIQFQILSGKFSKMSFMLWHLPASEDGGIQMVGHSSMIQTVQVTIVQHHFTFISQNIHIVFQQNPVTCQGTCLIYTKYIHAAESLHDIDVFHYSLF